MLHVHVSVIGHDERAKNVIFKQKIYIVLNKMNKSIHVMHVFNNFSSLSAWNFLLGGLPSKKNSFYPCEGNSWRVHLLKLVQFSLGKVNEEIGNAKYSQTCTCYTPYHNFVLYLQRGDKLQ